MNWIKQQAECQISFVFPRLCKEVEATVREMEKYAPALKRACSFTVDQHSDRLTVQCQSDWAQFAFTVSFHVHKDKDSIEVKIEGAGNRNRTHEIYPLWNPKKERCVLFFDDEPLEYEEACKRIFQPLFFAKKEADDAETR